MEKAPMSPLPVGSQSRAGTPIPRPTSARAVSDEKILSDRFIRHRGDLNLVFESQSGRVVYVGKCSLEVPAQLTKGKEYRFSVQDAHEATFSQLAPQHGHLTQQAVTAPMRIRQDENR